jgi:hypothetical protein
MIKTNQKFILILLISAVISCSSQKPPHFIYGKWESKNHPGTVLNFGDDNLLKVEIVDEMIEKNIKYSYYFKIVDDKTVQIDDHVEPEYKSKIWIALQNDGEIRLSCSSRRSPEGRVMVDRPEICMFNEFVRSK